MIWHGRRSIFFYHCCIFQQNGYFAGNCRQLFQWLYRSITKFHLSASYNKYERTGLMTKLPWWQKEKWKHWLFMYRWILCIEICLFKISVVLCEHQSYTLVGNIYVSTILFKERNRLFKTFWIRRRGICYNVLSTIGDKKSIFLLWIHYIPRNMDIIVCANDYTHSITMSS